MELHPFLLAAAGGVLIGLSEALLLAGLGKTVGISGILGGLTRAKPSDRAWRTGFIVGLVASGALVAALVPAWLVNTVDNGPVMLVAGGLLVGFGARLGSGCTSGHGVCGLSRFSLRSLVATGAFMGVAGLTVYVVQHLLRGAP